MNQAEAIRRFIERRNIKIEPWCRKAGVAASALYNLLNAEQGKAGGLSARTLQRLAAVQNVPISVLLGEIDEIALDIRSVPVISLADLALFLRGEGRAAVESRSKLFVPIVGNKSNVWAVPAPDKSLNRSVPCNAILAIDMDAVQLQDGSFYLLYREGAFTCRRFANEKGPPRLEPDSTDSFETFFLEGEAPNGCQVVGKIFHYIGELP